MWNAELYDLFRGERMQPSVDLANRLRGSAFGRIADIGCGTGMSTAALADGWPNAEIVGLDRSAEMLEKARQLIPQALFLQRDCSLPPEDLGTFDLVFSNAFLQWIPDPEGFVANAGKMLNPEGVFAAQVPLFWEMPARRCIRDAAIVVRGTSCLDAVFSERSPAAYYETLERFFCETDMWITEYVHCLESPRKIVEFLGATALQPDLDVMGPEEQRLFREEVFRRIERAYPSLPSGKVLFPFRRLFFIGRRNRSFL